MKNNLSTLSVLHYVYGGLTCFGGLAMLVLVLMGHFLGSDFVRNESDGDPAPAVVGTFFIVLGWVLFAFAELMGILILVSGARIAQGRGRMFSMVVACLMCLSFPIGTALGVWTVITLNSEEVRAAYGELAARA